MVTAEVARNAARDYALRHRTGWSEKFTTIKTGFIEGRNCYQVHTSSIDFENKAWYEFETSTPVTIYVDAVTGKCFGHQYGNRGFRPGL